MATEAERCSARSLALDEPLIGTASVVSTWVMLEHPGPWGARALHSTRLPRGLGEGLRELSANLGVRVVLIRRHRPRSKGGSVSCFLANTGPGEPWLEHLSLEDPVELLGFDLSPLAQGLPSGGGRRDGGPLFLVCTHGRRDPCCAERGRPLARALDLDRTHGERSWEVSHIGGDRFAGNLVCFPHGLYFGRLDTQQGIAAATDYAEGRIDLEHYRGRSCYGFAVQAAETFLRRHVGSTGVDDVRLVRTDRPAPQMLEATFDTPSGRHAVRVAVQAADQARTLTCHSTTAASPPTYSLIRMAGEG